MKKRLYYMKDLLEKFQVSRDSLKYYEKIGLVSPKRSGAGYRLYSKLDVLKLKKVFSLRNIGFPLNKTDVRLLSMDEQLCMEEIENVRMKTKDTIVELEMQLKKLKVFEEWLVESKEMVESGELKIVNDFTLCYECDRFIQEYMSNIMVHEMCFLHRSKSGGIEIKDEKLVIFPKRCMKLISDCVGCTGGKSIAFDKAVLRKCRGKEEELEDFVNQMYKDAKEQGVRLQNDIYCRVHYADKNGKECFLYEIYIPVEEE